MNSTLRGSSQEERNRAANHKWYRKQKAANKGLEGYVYAICVEGEEDIFVGGTENSLPFRLRQHRTTYSNCATNDYDKDKLSIVELQKVPLGESLKKFVQVWIDLLSPELNKINAIREEEIKHKRCWKGGVEYRGKWYPTKIKLWMERGEVPYGTFKSRLHRGKSLEEALTR